LITTSYEPNEELIQQATALAKRFGWRYIARERNSLQDLFRRFDQSQAIVVAKNGWRYEDQEGNHFSFHPNMSALRIKQLKNGQKDLMVECAKMTTGDAVLDCTLGMAADAIVSSFVVGEKGKVVALESQPVIAAIVEHGLATYETDRKELQRAMRSVQVIHANYREVLPTLPDHSFDIVMFDPMFRKTVQKSAAMQQLKPLANPDPVDLASVQEAVRVARKAVLLKERRGSPEFQRLGFRVVKEAATYAWGIKEGD